MWPVINLPLYHKHGKKRAKRVGQSWRGWWGGARRRNIHLSVSCDAQRSKRDNGGQWKILVGRINCRRSGLMSGQWNILFWWTLNRTRFVICRQSYARQKIVCSITRSLMKQDDDSTLYPFQERMSASFCPVRFKLKRKLLATPSRYCFTGSIRFLKVHYVTTASPNMFINDQFPARNNSIVSWIFRGWTNPLGHSN